MQHLCGVFLAEGPPSLATFTPMSNPGKVLRVVIELKHMLHRLCGPPSIPLSFTLASVLPRRDTYRVSYDTEEIDFSSV